MYVLHHGDKPELYHGLPNNPTISPTVTFWKNIWKPLAAVGFAVTFASAFFHYLTVGPNRVSDEDEAQKPPNRDDARSEKSEKLVNKKRGITDDKKTD